MTKTTLKTLASLRGTNAVSDAATQLRERQPAQSTHVALSPCRNAFTMAEILLSLTIIGVVAAITLPSLMANINERTWNTQRKALYARMSQAIAMMPQIAGYGTLTVTTDEDGSTTVTDTATESFLTEGLSKVLKINNICDNAHLADCGIPTSYTNMAGTTSILPTTLYSLNTWFRSAAYSGSSYSTMDTKAAAFETQNGESIVAYYNHSCKYEYLNEASLTQYGNVFGFPEATMCVNFLYDLNGNKGPNTIGKDMGFITSSNSNDPIVVAPMPSSSENAGTSAWAGAASLCTTQNPESRIPNIDELSAMLINKDLINLTASAYFWSGSGFSAGRALSVRTYYGARVSDYKSTVHYVRCVLR